MSLIINLSTLSCTNSNVGISFDEYTKQIASSFLVCSKNDSNSILFFLKASRMSLFIKFRSTARLTFFFGYRNQYLKRNFFWKFGFKNECIQRVLFQTMSCCENSINNQLATQFIFLTKIFFHSTKVRSFQAIEKHCIIFDSPTLQIYLSLTLNQYCLLIGHKN